MNTFNFLQQSPYEINLQIAGNIRRLRKYKKISQALLSERSGVSLGSIKRFEQSGEISLISLTKIAVALDVAGDLEKLFTDMPISSIEELIYGNS